MPGLGVLPHDNARAGNRWHHLRDCSSNDRRTLRGPGSRATGRLRRPHRLRPNLRGPRESVAAGPQPGGSDPSHTRRGYVVSLLAAWRDDRSPTLVSSRPF